MDRQGVFTSRQEDYIISMIFFFARFNNKILQWAAKPFISMVVRGVDNFILDRIRPDWKADIIPIVDAAANGHANIVRQLAVDWTNRKVNIRHVSEDTEMEFIDSISRVLVTGTRVFSEYRAGLRLEKEIAA